MKHSFIRQLKQELPKWLEAGIIPPGTDHAILQYVEKDKVSKSSMLSINFAILGVILFGTGVITFFAANWDAMPKIIKLVLLFGVFWSAFVGANEFFKRDWNGLGHAMILLASILFGANIWLIAQIYHIDSHYPDGVLSWSLGAALAAYLLRSQASMVLAIALSLLWCGYEIIDFNHYFYWPFLLYLALLTYVVVQNKWRFSYHVLIIALIAWSYIQIIPIAKHWNDDLIFYMMQAYFIWFVCLFLLGFIVSSRPALQYHAYILSRYAALAAGIMVYIISIPVWFTHVDPVFDLAKQQAHPLGYINIALMVMAILLAVINFVVSDFKDRTKYLLFGYGVFATIVAVLCIKMFFGDDGTTEVLAVIFNIAYYCLLVWLIYAGVQREDRGLVNIGFIFFALALLARYIDTFWTLMNRSYFFMIGGLLLIVGGILIEKQRRKFTQQIELAKREKSHD